MFSNSSGTFPRKIPSLEKVAFFQWGIAIDMDPSWRLFSSYADLDSEGLSKVCPDFFLPQLKAGIFFLNHIIE